MTLRIPVWAHRVVDQLRERRLTLQLALPFSGKPTRPHAPEGIVIGMTSFPARIKTAWKAVETLLRQDVQRVPVVLVLSTEEFPTKKLPWRLASQTKRGLQILWTERNGRSFDKLLPLRAHYPEATIITVDDDKYFPPDTIRRLLEAHASHPQHIVGTRGWRVITPEGSSEVRFGVGWERSQPGDEGLGLHLPGGNGCLYPPGSLDPVVDDLDLALSLCPSADDMWFWAAAQLQQTPFLCLGMPAHRPVRAQGRTPALSHINTVKAEEQFQAVLDHFGFATKDIIWGAQPARKKK
jgi:hypothetical protein